MHWNAYCFNCFGDLERFVCNIRCTNLPYLLSVGKMHWNAYCFIGFGGLEHFVCSRRTNLPHCYFQWQKMHWNAYCFIGFGGLECFVCNRCTIKPASMLLLQWHKCTAEMPTASLALVTWSALFAQNAQICLTVAFSGKNALKCHTASLA